ncbi:hypothetical protein AU468_01510 [Alkalispirochaeta sphaeroplastigenens]|uniref:Uncharacterized protein n=1 Tax=Alkalispirochaeta sphaeroplastigenens TaxID=1187066 RepID=A0A2S4K0T5_9SPIO|nr:hypothetical protein [Alkalispirochaeta sphaeroplastigenens]POR05380.1 hypothetical protein AU468_01510 [Alkalispirochaeta sphaeroplastigenens]
MARNNYSGEKRRRELNKKRKQERKKREKAERVEAGGEDTSYLEYLNPGGPQDGRFIEDDEADGEEDDQDSSDET